MISQYGRYGSLPERDLSCLLRLTCAKSTQLDRSDFASYTMVTVLELLVARLEQNQPPLGCSKRIQHQCFVASRLGWCQAAVCTSLRPSQEPRSGQWECSPCRENSAAHEPTHRSSITQKVHQQSVSRSVSPVQRTLSKGRRGRANMQGTVTERT